MVRWSVDGSAVGCGDDGVGVSAPGTESVALVPSFAIDEAQSSWAGAHDSRLVPGDGGVVVDEFVEVAGVVGWRPGVGVGRGVEVGFVDAVAWGELRVEQPGLGGRGGEVVLDEGDSGKQCVVPAL